MTVRSSREPYNAELAADAALGLRRRGEDGQFGRHDPLVVEGGQAGLAAEVLLRPLVVHFNLHDRLQLHDPPENPTGPFKDLPGKHRRRDG